LKFSFRPTAAAEFCIFAAQNRTVVASFSFLAKAAVILYSSEFMFSIFAETIGLFSLGKGLFSPQSSHYIYLERHDPDKLNFIVVCLNLPEIAQYL